MHVTNTDRYSPVNILLIALWWGIVAGFVEGLNSAHHGALVWRDLIGASLLVDPLLFLGLGLIVIAFNYRIVTRGLLARATAGFAFLVLYTCSENIPRLFRLMPFLICLAGAGIAAIVLFLGGERVVRFQKWSLLPIATVAIGCMVLFPNQQRRAEARNLAQLGPTPPGAPNILVVLVDTLGADHLSTYGYVRDTSPNLTLIARGGVQFDNAIAASSWTLPSHASILTGLYPHAHHTEAYTADLGETYPTLAEALQARGYRTAAFSANAGTFSRLRGFGRGFIHFEDNYQTWGSSFGETFYGNKIEEKLCQLHLARDLLGRMNAADISKHAFHWIDTDHRPFFVFMNWYDLHDPYLPAAPYDHYYTRAKHPGGYFTPHWEYFDNMSLERRQAANDAYDGAVNYVDAQLGDLMRELQQRGLAEDTLLIITSDHGEGFDEHGLMNHGNSLYRELIHVPLIVREPGRVPAGKRVAEPVSLTALPATILDVVGLAGTEFAAKSLRGLWSNTPSDHRGFPPPHSQLAQMLWSSKYPNYSGPMESVTTSQWHYITGGNRGEELFHCCDSAKETPNLAATTEGQKICGQFRRELQASARSQAEVPLAAGGPPRAVEPGGALIRSTASVQPAVTGRPRVAR